MIDDIDTGDPIADLVEAVRRLKATSEPMGDFAYVQMRPEIYRAIQEALRRGVRHAKKTLRRRDPARHRPTWAKRAARKIRAAAYLAGLPRFTIRPVGDPKTWAPHGPADTPTPALRK